MDMAHMQRGESRTQRLQRLYELAAGQAGHFTASQAHEVGYSARSLVHHVAAGHIERVGRGFYRLGGVPVTPDEDVVATWLKWAQRGAVVSHDTALALYGLALGRSHAIHLIVPRARRPRTARGAGVSLHTTTVPLRRDEVANRFGVLVTQPSRTIADAADIGTDPSVVSEAVSRAFRDGLAIPDDLRKAVADRSARVRQLIERAIEGKDTDYPNVREVRRGAGSRPRGASPKSLP